jgi:uncharacterized repeat protein (TIGR03847 family)
VSERYLFDAPDLVTVGAVGPVGQRLFVLQVREGPQVLTVKVEKVQVSSLAAYLGRMLRDLDRPHELPEGAALALEEFDGPDFGAEALALSYDEIGDRVVLVIDELDTAAGGEEPDDLGRPENLGRVEPSDGAVARVAMTREQAAALAIRATELVEAGRPPCPLCGYPLDPRGHACPRTNGHSAPLT